MQSLTYPFPTLIALLRWSEPWGLGDTQHSLGVSPAPPHIAAYTSLACLLCVHLRSHMHFCEQSRKYHGAFIINGKTEELGVEPT